MEYALYRGKEFCSYSLKDSRGHYYEDLRKEMRKESQANRFICPECGEFLILNAGPILPPYFSHHKGSLCHMEQHGESREHREGRFLLYLLAKNSFQDAFIRTNYVHENKKRSHIYVETKQSKLAINYITSRVIIRDWEEKHQYYIDNHIKEVWILSQSLNINFSTENISLNSYLASQASDKNIIKLLDTVNQRITLLQFNSRSNSVEHGEAALDQLKDDNISSYTNRIFRQQTYDLSSLHLMEDGEFNTNFLEKDEVQVVRDCKEIVTTEVEYDEYQQMTFDFLEQDQKVHQKPNVKLNQKLNQKQSLKNGNNFVSIDKKENDHITEGLDKIIEYSILIEPIKNTFLLKSINTWWRLPEIQGSREEIKRANAKRLDYFIEKDKELLMIKEKEQRKKMIEEMKLYIESRLKAENWMNKIN